MSKVWVVLTPKQLELVSDACEEKALCLFRGYSDVMKALAAAQSGVLLPLEAAAAIVALAEEAPTYAWEENGLAVRAIERIRAAQEGAENVG